MKTSRVTVLPYDKAWKTAFDAIKTEVEVALGGLAIAVEHVGSTAVEGMSAKPCIDLDVVIADYGVLSEAVARLATIGYVHEGNWGIEGREAFDYKDKPHLYKHHLYVCPRDSRELHRLFLRHSLQADGHQESRHLVIRNRSFGKAHDHIFDFIRTQGAAKSLLIDNIYCVHIFLFSHVYYIT